MIEYLYGSNIREIFDFILFYFSRISYLHTSTYVTNSQGNYIIVLERLANKK